MPIYTKKGKPGKGKRNKKLSEMGKNAKSVKKPKRNRYGAQVSQKLDSLPKSDDKYWDHADVNIVEEAMPGPTCHHKFVMMSRRQAECKQCRIGYFLDPEMVVKKGHIYIHGSLVI